MIISFALGMLIYCLSAYTSFNAEFKKSNWFFVAGLGMSILANLIWMNIAKNTEDVSRLAVIGLYWDSMIVLAFLFVPMLVFGMELTTTQWVGVGLIVAGIFVTKV